MVKTTLIVGFLSFAVALNSHANDSDRIDRLEKEVQETKARLSKLESLLTNSGNAQNAVTSGDGWKSVTNWRKLSINMSTADVRRLLGEPRRLDGGVIATWHYENGGRITFYEEKIQRWAEPSQ